MNPNPLPRRPAMTDPHRCALSALVDGELSAYQGLALYSALGRDPQLRATWERYHLIGQAMRGAPVDPAVRGLADAVRVTTEPEPALAGPRRLPAGLRSWRAPFAGAVLAGGAILLSVFVVPAGHPVPPPVGLAGPARAAGTTAPVTALVPAPRRWETDRPELAGKLDRFLVHHQEAASAAGPRGLIPYVTRVGYEAPR